MIYLLELGRDYEAGTLVRVFRKRARAEAAALADYGVTVTRLDEKHGIPKDRRSTYDHVTISETETE